MLIITMAGASSRFKQFGYTKPKFLLKFGNDKIITHIIKSYNNFIKKNGALFVYNSNDIDRKQLTNLILLSGCESKSFELLDLKKLTMGQAETAAIAIETYKLFGPITIVNIDTLYSNWTGIDYAEKPLIDGYLDVTKWSGNNWSFIKNNLTGRVFEIAEKSRISDLTSTGLYSFKSGKVFLDYQKSIEKEIGCNQYLGEYFVSAVYKKMISDGLHIHSREIDKKNLKLFGTPQEYQNSCSEIGKKFDKPNLIKI
jgi:hypothetical protein